MELVITLLAIGAILLLLETVLPGLIAGIVGGCCLLAGLIPRYSAFGAQTGTWMLFGVVGGLLASFGDWVDFFPGCRFGRVLISKRVVGDIGTEKPDLLHQKGTAFTQLRPSGTALINGQRVDVVTEGPLIDKGTPIQVVATEGLRVVVRALANPPAVSPPEQPHRT